MNISNELIQIILFLEEEFYMQWHMDNYPQPVFQFLDGSYQPVETDTSEFLAALVAKACEPTGEWDGYNPSDMEDFIGDWRISLGFETVTSLKEEAIKRNLTI